MPVCGNMRNEINVMVYFKPGWRMNENDVLFKMIQAHSEKEKEIRLTVIEMNFGDECSDSEKADLL